MRSLAPPPGRPLDALLAGVPGRARALGEVGWFVAALLGLAWLEAALGALGLGSSAVELGVYTGVLTLVLWAYALIRPWRLWRAGSRWRAVVVTALIAPLALISAIGPVMRAGGPPPRIGIELDDAPHPNDPARQVAEVLSVSPGSPAGGRLMPGDLVLALNGELLDASAPADDLSRRARDPRALPAGEARFSVLRGGREQLVTLTVSTVQGPSALRQAFRATLLRNLALLGALWLMLGADGQRLSALGFDRTLLRRELRATLPAFAMLLLSHFLISLVVTAVALAGSGSLLETELAQRGEVAATLIAEHITTTLPLIVLASATEEVVFRGFMLPRLRVLSGGWRSALVTGAVLFGLGHVYEGTLAVVQTAGIGFVLGLIFVWRRQLVACVLSHVGFNALALLLGLLVVKLGWLSRAAELIGR